MKLTLEEKATLITMNDKFGCLNKNGLLNSLLGNQEHLYNIIRFNKFLIDYVTSVSQIRTSQLWQVVFGFASRLHSHNSQFKNNEY